MWHRKPGRPLPHTPRFAGWIRLSALRRLGRAESRRAGEKFRHQSHERPREAYACAISGASRVNAEAGAGAKAARHTEEQGRTIKIAYDGLPVGGKLGDYSFTQAMRVLAYRAQQLTPPPKINFNQPTDDEGYLISELDAYLVFPKGALMEEISAQPWEKFRHVPYVAGAKPIMGFVSRKWMEKIGRKKCCWKHETACPGGVAAPCNARKDANNVAGFHPYQAASSAGAWQGGGGRK